MNNYKSNAWKNHEKFGLIFVLMFVFIQGFLSSDQYAAIISAVCGITYTFLAGKGLPICYLFGVTGSSFYSFLSFQNALWGNLILYMCYYVPMQILGYFRWNKHLKKGQNEIKKICLSRKELLILLLALFVLTFIVYYLLVLFKDSRPILDSVTTVFSIGGMYLTVRRALEQWIFWMVVNALSLIMWIGLAMQGAKTYSTIFMWAVYLLLAIYFYIRWRQEIKAYRA